MKRKNKRIKKIKVKQTSDEYIKYPHCLNSHPLDKDCSCDFNGACRGNTIQEEIEFGNKKIQKKDDNCFGNYIKSELQYQKINCKKCKEKESCISQSVLNENFKSQERKKNFFCGKNVFIENNIARIPWVDSNIIRFSQNKVLNKLLYTCIHIEDQIKIKVYELIENTLYIQKIPNCRLPLTKDILLLSYIFEEMYKNNNNTFSINELASIYQNKKKLAGKSYKTIKKTLKWACKTKFIAKKSFFINNKPSNNTNNKPSNNTNNKQLICFSLLNKFKIYKYLSKTIIKIYPNKDWINSIILENIKNTANGNYIPVSYFKNNIKSNFAYTVKFINSYYWGLENLKKRIFPLKYVELKKLNKIKNDITLSISAKNKIVKKIYKRQDQMNKKILYLINQYENIYYELDKESLIKNNFHMTKLLIK